MISDELLNNYIDGELDRKTQEEVLAQLKNSEADRRRLAELQAVHTALKKISPDEVSSGFTERVMIKLRSQGTALFPKSKWIEEQKRFVFGITSIFISLCLLILGYLLYAFVTAPQSSEDPSADYSGLIDNATEGLINFVMSVNLSIVGSVLSGVILISAYFFFEAMKKSKERYN